MSATLRISSARKYEDLQEVWDKDVRVSTVFARAESMLQPGIHPLVSTTVNRRDEHTITVLYELDNGRRFDDTYVLSNVALADLLEDFIRSGGR